LTPPADASLIVQATPGYNLPQTTVNQLTLHLPLQIASLSRYLHQHGFAPHIRRQHPTAGLRVMEEEYCCATSSYRVVFSLAPHAARGETRIRFHGASFARGRFDVGIQHRAEAGCEWKVEYDVPPVRPPEVVRQESGATGLSFASNLGQHRKSSLSVLGSPPPPSPALLSVDLAGEPHRTLSPSPLGNGHFTASPTSASPVPLASPPLFGAGPTPLGALPPDPARHPGPLGGCTIVIANASLAGGPPVVVTINPNAEATKPPLGRLMAVSAALREASKVVHDAGGVASVDELLEGDWGEERVRRRLETVGRVMEVMQIVKAADVPAVGQASRVEPAERGEGPKGRGAGDGLRRSALGLRGIEED